MAKLGKCLVFYLKYPAEMDRLYWQPRETGKPAVTDGLKEKDNVMAMVKKVGDAACREAATFLGPCADRIQAHLDSIGIARRVRRNLEEWWSVYWRVSPKKRPDRSFNVGFDLYDDPPEIVPWMWSKGRGAADEILRILGRGRAARSFSDLAGWGAGAFVLARIKVPVPDRPHEFDVEQEPLLDQVRTALTFNSSEIKAIAAITLRNRE
jgi:hypothetical protein